ncbi:MAG: ATP-binding protein [Myxococcota bacterium]
MVRALTVITAAWCWFLLGAAPASAEPPAEEPVEASADPEPEPKEPAPPEEPRAAEHAAEPDGAAADPTSVAPDVPTPEPDVEPAPAAAEPQPATTDEALALRAERIRALVDGTLAPGVDARNLFTLDLADPAWGPNASLRFGTILGRLDAPQPKPRRRRRRPKPRPPLEGLSPDQALEDALVEFFGFTVEQRAALFAAHDAKRRAAKIEAATDEGRRVQAKDVQRQADQLRAYLAGTLDLDVDPAPLLAIDVLESHASTRKDPSWIASNPDATEALRVALADLDLQQQRYLALSEEEKAEVASTHAARIAAATAEAEAKAAAKAEAEAAAARAEAEAQAAADATAEDLEAEEARAEAERDKQAATEILSDAEAEAAEAARERDQALAAARLADTEAKRIVAEETARLHGILEAQANYEAVIARRKVEHSEDHATVLDWTERVRTLAAQPKFASELAAEADPMYQDVRAQLDVLRTRLQNDLKRLRKSGENVPGVGEPLDAKLSSAVDRGEIPALRSEVAENENELIEFERSTGWDLAEQARDDVVALNLVRLQLLDLASSGLRRSVTGFGADGVDQVKREFKQISLEVGFFGLSLPHYRQILFDEIKNSTIQVFLAFAKLGLLIAAFAWWRRRGTEILKNLETSLRERRPASQVDRILIATVWYFQRIRKPLVMLAVIWGLLYVIADINGIPSLALVWIAARWILLGLAGVLLVDAIAARENLYTASRRDNSQLRMHSLRVVGANVIAVGLVLALTSAMVGRGAIYSWVISTCWILSFPVAIYLVHRWKPIIFELIEERPEQTAFTQWIAGQESGLSSFPAAAAGAGYLLGMGSLSWLMRQLSGLEVTRRLLAYLFRRELAKQAAATEADERFKPIEKKVRPFFDPEAIPEDLQSNIANAQLERVAALVVTGSRTLSAVVGERGAGKSVFAKRLAATVEGADVHIISCPEEGFEALQAELAKAAGKPKAKGEDVAKAVRSLGKCVIVIDDIQRLVVPAVNGLRGLDEFIALSREVGGGISWVVTIGAAAWQFIRRARGDRVSFEQVVMLPRWTEDELGGLIRSQCEKADIDPSFEGLVVPRQNGEPLPDQGDRTEASYYRLLWDFSKGNPAVAMLAFRDSLFRDEQRNVVVRLFKEPPAEEVEGLTLSVLFVLRTIVQLELALLPEIEAATQLPATDVEDAVRFCTSRGYLEPYQGGVRLSWPWYRTITTVLQRQHLLSAFNS